LQFDNFLAVTYIYMFLQILIASKLSCRWKHWGCCPNYPSKQIFWNCATLCWCCLPWSHSIWLPSWVCI